MDSKVKENVLGKTPKQYLMLLRTYVFLTFHKSFTKDITSIRLRKGGLNIGECLVRIARAVKSNYEFCLKHSQKY